MHNARQIGREPASCCLSGCNLSEGYIWTVLLVLTMHEAVPARRIEGKSPQIDKRTEDLTHSIVSIHSPLGERSYMSQISYGQYAKEGAQRMDQLVLRHR
jgi:hypothetical protein